MPSRPRVLLADDHPGVAKAMSRRLSLDCDVVEVIGDGGLMPLPGIDHRRAVAVVDVNLPNVSGLEICRAITRANPGARVIVITGMLDEAIEEEALAAGASGFFPKYAAADDLVAAIGRAWAETQH